jgi:CheY-like chemotaxis protein
LVVEDDPVMLGLIVSLLNSVGIEKVTTAKDGILAWQLFEDGGQFDLVICDWMMPAMDGLEVLKNIRAGRSAIPFILVTARNTEAAVRRAVDCGITAYVAKPFEPEQLRSEVVAILSESTLQVEDGSSEFWEF